MPVLWCQDGQRVYLQIRVQQWSMFLVRRPEETVSTCGTRLLLKSLANPGQDQFSIIEFVKQEGANEHLIARVSTAKGVGVGKDQLLPDVLRASSHMRLTDEVDSPGSTLLPVIENLLGFTIGLACEQKMIVGLPVILNCDLYTPHLLCEWFLIKNETDMLTLLPPTTGKKNGRQPSTLRKYYSQLHLELEECDPRRSKLALKVGEGFRFKLTGPDSENYVDTYLIARVSMRDGGAPEVFALAFNNEKLARQPASSAWVVKRQQQLIMRQQYADWSRVRVCSWNILAPVYAATDLARDEIFSHCDQSSLVYEYRKPFLAAELERINADVFCLQEVGKEVYHNLLLGFEDLYEARLYLKATKADEGLAILARRSRFRIKAERRSMFKTQFMQEPEYADLRDELNKLWSIEGSETTFCERVLARMSCVVGFMLLEETDDLRRNYLIMDTHFFWHPKASHIRALQCYFAVREALKLMDESTKVIFCGDLNADEGTATLDLLIRGSVDPEHPSWKQAREYLFGGADEVAGPAWATEGPALALPLNLAAAEFQDLSFTNNVGSFRAVLDWIFTNLKQEWSLAGVTEVDFCECANTVCACGLPTASFPSDHIPLVADFFS